jgi:TFIIF-interacting CTD phosphatase-like protein
MANRRKFIAGLGALATGSAAAMGTGAFTSVEASRTLSIDTAGDANAFLSISKATDSSGNVYPNAKEYVHGNPRSGQVSLDFSQADDTSESSASGINKNAKTVFDNLLDITNNGTQEVNLSIESSLIASNDGVLGIYAENKLGDGGADNNSFQYNDTDGDDDPDTPNKVTLSPGKSVTNIGVYIPKGNSTGDLSGGTLTFVAEKTGGNKD